MNKAMKILISCSIGLFLFLEAVYAQTAGLMPNAEQTFLSNNGTPLAGGSVTTYVVGTTTLKTTWRDAAETVANTNPIVLDSAGRAIIYGDGSYRQVVRDRNGNLIWDQITSAFGTGGATTFGDGMAVGTIVTWSGLIAPTHYVFTYGQELSRTTYSSLLTAITLTATASCASGSPILTGFSDTTQIPTGAAIEASCLPGGTTVISTTASTITVSNNANITVSPSVKIFPWGNGNGTSTFNVPDLRGRVLPGRDNMGGTNAARLTTALFGTTPDAIGATGGAQSKVLLGANLPAYTPTGTIALNAHTHFVASTNGGAASALSNSTQMDISATQSGSPIAYSLTGSATAATIGLTSSTTTTGTFSGVAQGGTATAFATIQPSITVNYIIKVLPDTNLSSTGFVTSIGGMTGDILCGTGVTCADNTITVSGGGGGSGTVTSVALSMPGIFSVSGSPVTTTGTLAVAANGTSGGIPYFSSSSTLASSSALTANLPVIGGGAGTAPSVGGRTGNTTTFVTSAGGLISGNCAKWDASGNLIDSGGTCGGGGGGGSPGGSSTQVQYNNAGSFGGIAGATTDGTALTIASGDFKLGGASSGSTVVMASSVASGTITIPAATDTLVGKATTDTLTNKTYDTAGTGNSFLINGLAATANTGTGAVARATSPTLVTPVLGVATATSINGLSISTTAGTLTIPNNASAALITSGNFNLTLTATNTTNSTLPAGSHTLAALDVAQTWTSAQSFNDGTLKVNGATSGALTIDCAGTCGTNTLTLPAGTTDFSATGGASQVVKQTSSGGAFSVARLACSDLSDAGSFCSTSGAFTGALVLTSNANPCFAVGPSGNTNPMFRVICNTASAATGVQITGAAAAGGVALAAISSGTNEGLSINAKGSGGVSVGSTSTGDIVLGNTSGGQVRANGAAGTVALRFVNDNLTGLGSRAALEFNAYANSTEVMRWAQTNITAFSTLTAASTLVSNVTRTIASANLQAGTSSWADVNTQASTTTISGSTNISSFVLAKNQFEVPVLTASAAAVGITSAINLYVAGAPTTSSSGGFTPTITNPYALYVASGLSFFGGGVSTNNTNNGYGLFVSHSPTITSAATVTWQSFAASSTLTLTGTTTVSNDTAMAVFGQPLITDASAVTVSKASTVYIGGEPIGGGSATVTAAGVFALKIASGNVSHAASSYINFGNTSGTTGYGFRDNSGTMQFSNSGGSWTNFGGSTLTIGSTTIGSGTTGRLLWDNAAVLGESTNIYTDGTVFNMGSSTNFAFGLTTATWQLNGTSSGSVQAGIGGYSASSGGTINNAGQFAFYRSRSGTIGTATVVAQDDALGTIRWFGAQQTGTIATQTVAASIRAEVDGVVTSGASADMPGRLILATTPDGSGTVTDSLKIDNAGNWFMLLAGSTDSGKVTNTICRDTTTGQLYRGSGTAGICVGTSSARFKHNIQDLDVDCSKLASLKPKKFFYNKGYGDDGEKQQYGFIAEDVYNILPELVGLDSDGRPNTVDMFALIPIFTQCQLRMVSK